LRLFKNRTNRRSYQNYMHVLRVSYLLVLSRLVVGCASSDLKLE